MPSTARGNTRRQRNLLALFTALVVAAIVGILWPRADWYLQVGLILAGMVIFAVLLVAKRRTRHQ